MGSGTRHVFVAVWCGGRRHQGRARLLGIRWAHCVWDSLQPGAGVAEEWCCRDSICVTPGGDGCSAAGGGELLVVALAVSVESVVEELSWDEVVESLVSGSGSGSGSAAGAVRAVCSCCKRCGVIGCWPECPHRWAKVAALEAP